MQEGQVLGALLAFGDLLGKKKYTQAACKREEGEKTRRMKQEQREAIEKEVRDEMRSGNKDRRV